MTTDQTDTAEYGDFTREVIAWAYLTGDRGVKLRQSPTGPSETVSFRDFKDAVLNLLDKREQAAKAEIKSLEDRLLHVSSALTAMTGVVRHVTSGGCIALIGPAVEEFQRAQEHVDWLCENHYQNEDDDREEA